MKRERKKDKTNSPRSLAIGLEVGLGLFKWLFIR